MNLKRIRWAVRGVLVLGVAASVVANVLHARHNPISQSIAAWPPLALLLTVELISRIPVHQRWLAVARVAATALIAGIAAWVSYWHMAGVAARYGETGAAPYLIPISVDGLIVVASICLVELGGRIRQVEPVDEIAVEPVAQLVDEPPADPWRYATPIEPESSGEPISEPQSEPAEPAREPRPEPIRKRVTPRSLTAAERVVAAHAKHPDATHIRIAELADVSLATVKRHRPNGSPSEPPPAETPAPERVNGHRPELVDLSV